MKKTTHDSRDDIKVEEGKPPFFNSWRGMYRLVLLNLLILIIIFTIITIYYR